jgi:acetyltransferase
MTATGHDMFIGGLQDPSFGPMVFFGYGGIYVEVFKDVERILCPSSIAEIQLKVQQLQSYKILAGMRGRKPVDTAPFARSILNIAQLMADFPQIVELDVNPMRIVEQGEVLALDARMRIDTV